MMNNRKTERNSQGFTLMEIMVVIIIIGVLASLAIPRFLIALEKTTKVADAVNILQVLFAAQKRYAIYDLDHLYTSAMNKLDIQIETPQGFLDPSLSTSDPPGLAQIMRNKPSPYNYTLYIHTDGSITCGGSSICTQLGY